MKKPRTARRTIRQNFSSSLIGHVVYAASQFAMLSVLTHSADSTIVGAYVLALAVLSPAYILIEMRLRLLESTDAGERFKFGIYLAHRLTSISVPLVCISTYALVQSRDALDARILVSVAVYKAVESLLDVAYGAMARAERLDLTRVSMLWRSAGNLTLFAAIIIPTQRVDIAYLLMAVYNIVCLSFALRHVSQLGESIRPRWELKSIKRLSIIGFPIGLAFAMGSLGVNVPRYAVQGYHGPEELAIFATAAYVLVAITTVINALTQATTPRLAHYFELREVSQFRRLRFKTFAIGAFIGGFGVIGASVLGEPFLKTIFGAEYAAGHSSLIVLMCAAAVQYLVSLMRAMFVAMREYRVALPVSIANLITVITVSLLLVPLQASLGAAIALLSGLLVSFSCYASLQLTLGRRILRRRERSDTTGA